MAGQPLTIPRDQDNVILTVDRKDVRLTNLRKIFWQELGLTKGDLLQYYADVAAVLLHPSLHQSRVPQRLDHHDLSAGLSRLAGAAPLRGAVRRRGLLAAFGLA